MITHIYAQPVPGLKPFSPGGLHSFYMDETPVYPEHSTDRECVSAQHSREANSYGEVQKLLLGMGCRRCYPVIVAAEEGLKENAVFFCLATLGPGSCKCWAISGAETPNQRPPQG